MRRADLLLALDEHLHVAGERAGGVEPCLDHRAVGDGAGLVVGAPAPVQATLALDRLERVRRPVVFEPRRLHVVVRIQEDGRRAVGMHPLADDRGWRVLDGGLTHVLEPARLEVGRGRVGAVLHVDVAIGVRADARDAHEVLERDPGLVDAGVDRRDDVVDGRCR